MMPTSPLPVVAIVGRPNVGKSTLFNQLTRTRDALVLDQPGVTRDRQYGQGKVGDRPYIVIDTGGIGGEEVGLDGKMAAQARIAVGEADVVLLMLDARDGLTALDQALAQELRRLAKTTYIVVNKCDGLDADAVMADFSRLGFPEIFLIAAAHGRGVNTVADAALADFPDIDAETLFDDLPEGIKVAIVGRPNVGKSTLVNRILGEERVVAFDEPGTTRTSIAIPFTRHDKHYVLIDTAGVRRRARVNETLEKFSVIKTLQTISASHVAVLVIDAQTGLGDQDLRLLDYIITAGKALVIAVNKWDGLSPYERERIHTELDRRIGFADFADTLMISALHGTGVGLLYEAVDKAYASAMIPMSTPELTRLLEKAGEAFQPPLVQGRRVKLRYAHPGGHNPPTIIIHGNQTSKLPDSYKRYLNNFYRQALDIKGSPIRLEFKTGENPYQPKTDKPKTQLVKVGAKAKAAEKTKIKRAAKAKTQTEHRAKAARKAAGIKHVGPVGAGVEAKGKATTTRRTSSAARSGTTATAGARTRATTGAEARTAAGKTTTTAKTSTSHSRRTSRIAEALAGIKKPAAKPGRSTTARTAVTKGKATASRTSKVSSGKATTSRTSKVSTGKSTSARTTTRGSTVKTGAGRTSSRSTSGKTSSPRR